MAIVLSNKPPFQNPEVLGQIAIWVGKFSLVSYVSGGLSMLEIENRFQGNLNYFKVEEDGTTPHIFQYDRANSKLRVWIASSGLELSSDISDLYFLAVGSS